MAGIRANFAWFGLAYSNIGCVVRYIFALLAFTNAAWADCAPRQEAFMTCQIEDSSKTISVCFDAHDVSYRFGVPGQPPELELHDRVATVNYTPWPGVGRSIWEAVKFENDGFSYVVFGGFERMFGDEEYEDVPHRGFGGVRVTRGDEEIITLTCARETVDFAWGEGLWTAKHDLGIVWDYQTETWIAPPE